MQEILEIVGKPDLETQEDEDNKVSLLEELEDIVDNLDMADCTLNFIHKLSNLI